MGALLSVALLVAGGPSPAGSVGAATASRAERVAGTDRALAELEDRFLTTRPPVGPTWVVQVAGESSQRILTVRTLQGLVNRTAARIYVIDGGDGGAQLMLDRYVDRGLVTIAATTTIDGAFDQFASEAAGYVLADLAEPWSVHAASVIAGLEDGIVATPDQVAGLQGRGLVELDDTRGRWPDAATAYEALATTYSGQLASDTMAVIRPTDTLWDFVAQQGILPVFSRPSDPTWGRVRAVLDDIPEGLPVYGYLSDTGEEEAIAVASLAQMGLVLVPTDTTRNLSFHVAVGADLPRQRMAAPDLSAVEECTTDTVNVVLGLTDGDNMNVPLNHLLRGGNWDSPRRGDVALGWSIGPDLAVLAPAAWDGYVLEATDRDELVAMIGWGYGAPALLPDATEFYATSFELMADLGMQTFWSLGGGLETPGSGYWDDFETAAGSGVPTGVLIGYGNGSGSAFHSPAGRPAFTSRAQYSETPAQMAAHVEALQAMSPADRPVVSFLSATNWSNPAGALIDALAPYEAEGVRFLTPSEATACMPDAIAPPPSTAQRCSPQPPLAQSGLALISEPTATEILRTGSDFALPIAVEAPDAVEGGGVIDYTATIELDIPTFAATTLADRVQPIVEAGYGPELAETAWIELGFTDLTLPIPMGIGTTPTGEPTATSTGPPVVASWGAEGVELHVPAIDEDSRAPGEPFTVTLRWSALARRQVQPVESPIWAGALSFDLRLVVGVVLLDTPLVGAVDAWWGCGSTGETLATTHISGVTPTPVPLPATPATPITAIPTVTG